MSSGVFELGRTVSAGPDEEAASSGGCFELTGASASVILSCCTWSRTHTVDFRSRPNTLSLKRGEISLEM